ncbi:hypothetical protein T09_11790 [Trichinella sp. T9]|nr:hypothetical protein T09_11790 [Trichinella sp. T9]
MGGGVLVKRKRKRKRGFCFHARPLDCGWAKCAMHSGTGWKKNGRPIYSHFGTDSVETEVELRKVSENVENPSRWWENEVTGAARPPQAIPSLLSLVDTGR